MPDTIPPRAWALLLLLSLLWGGSFFFIAVALRDVPPLTLVASRALLAAAALWIAARTLGLRIPPGRAALVTLLGMGVLNNVIPFTLIAWAQLHLASGVASILNATTPVWGVLLGAALGAAGVTKLRAAGVVSGFAGVVLLMGVDKLAAPGSDTLAVLAMLGATLSYAAAGLWAKRLAHDGIPPLIGAAGQCSVSTVLLGAAALALETPWALPLPSTPALAALLALGLFSTGLAYALFFRVIELAGGMNAMLVTFLIPPVAIALGVAVLGETFLARHALGCLVILLGLALIDGRLFRRFGLSADRAAR
jgi:drug/metabolite transporter (DMT)-like permease